LFDGGEVLYEFLKEKEEEIKEEVIIYKENVPDLTAKIESISQFGILTIRFSEDL
jgi:hypothetical protein